MSNPHMRGRLTPQITTAVVTGAGGGLGREVARRFARDGADVFCADVDAEALSRTVDVVEGYEVACGAAVVDVADEVAVARWYDEVTRFGAPEALVNCGGILDRRPTAEVTLEEFMDVLRVNLGGCYATTRAFAPAMAEARWGRIVNIASIAGLTGYPFAAYAASKAGVVNLTRSMLRDLWGTGVTVNAVCPGAMLTPMLDRGAAQAMTRQTPAGTLADPADVADVVAFLCSSAARSINGAAIVVDGGATAYFAYESAPGAGPAADR